MPMSPEERAEFEWYKNEVARLRELLEPTTDVPTRRAPKVGGARPVPRSEKVEPQCRTCEDKGRIYTGKDGMKWVFCPSCDPCGHNVPPEQRTVKQVETARQYSMLGGCCDLFADNKGCACLAIAQRREANLKMCDCGQATCYDCRVGYRG